MGNHDPLSHKKKKKKTFSTCIGFDNLLERLCTSDQWFYWTCRYDNQSF
jgi:hypothetical protein